ncbi:hypothetical protein AB5I41_13810 [Sphingomonas sp. MMS24-JH45]
MADTRGSAGTARAEAADAIRLCQPRAGRRAADAADPRRSLYRAEDIVRLEGRRMRGRATAAIATGAIAWGEPIVDTALSTVVQGRLA